VYHGSRSAKVQSSECDRKSVVVNNQRCGQVNTLPKVWTILLHHGIVGLTQIESKVCTIDSQK
jgi:hypothetical protein